MSAYTDSTGRVWHGSASPEDVEALVAWQRRERLAAERASVLRCVRVTLADLRARAGMPANDGPKIDARKPLEL